MHHKHIIIVAGEPSADMHGAALAKELFKLRPNLRISGIGSQQMRQAGVETFADLSRYAVIGFIEVIKHFSTYKKIFNQTLNEIRKNSPQVVILIDFPGFNLRLAKQIKKDFPNVKIIYYISPQVWAWGKKRIELIKKTVDKMIVVFEFEHKLYKENGIDVEFVGHPLLENIHITKNNSECCLQAGLNSSNIIIGLLPGSREIEVKRILPVLLKSAELVIKEIPNAQFLLLKAANIKISIIEKIMPKNPNLPIRVIDNDTYNHLNICSFAWVCSGTATLETAIIGTPMLIVYKTSFITWLISRALIKLPYIGLVNVVAQEKIVPEFVQYQAIPKNISNCTIDFLKQGVLVQAELKNKLQKVKEKLGTPRANQKAAQCISNLIID